MNILQEKSSRRFVFSLLLIFALSLLLNLAMILEQGRFTRRLLLEQNRTIASALLQEDLPRDLAARVLTGSQISPEGIRLLNQLGMDEKIFLLSAWTPDAPALFSFFSLFLIFALVFAAALRFLLWQERLYQSAIPVISAYTEGMFGQQLPQSCDGTIYRLFTSVNHMAAALKAGQELEHQTKDFLRNTISDISHQLKTPLTALGILTDILSAPQLSDEKRLETVGKAQAQLEKIQWLIRSLLVLSQLDAGVLALKREDVELCALLDGVCSSLEVLADVQDVTLCRAYGPEPIPLRCDREWTREALANIVKNCIEHSPGGTVTLSIRQHNFSTDLTIQDNGRGIPREELPHIFTRFYKGRGSSANSAGLGLALSKQIILMQNGLLSAESQEGAGTCFSIRFYPAG